MTSYGYDPASELRRLIAEGGISDETLRVVTEIPEDGLASFVDASCRADASGLSAAPAPLRPEEGARLSMFAAQLTEGFLIDDDERVTAIIETLTAQFHLTLTNIARLTGVDLGSVQDVADDPSAVPDETKYRIAVRISALLLAVANARPGSGRSA